MERPAATALRDSPREACGLFGVYGHPRAFDLVREGLFALQHRGQEGAGITVSDGVRLHTVKGQGLLNEAIRQSPPAEVTGRHGIGHVRYSTTGSSHFRNVQPLEGECVDGLWAVAHNGNLVNAHLLRRQYQEAGALFQTGTDSEILLHLLADARYRTRVDRVTAALGELRGAYSFLLMNDRQVMAVRDPRGFKPLSVGRLDQAWVFASESCALTQVGASVERELDPGELVVVDAKGLRSYQMPPAERHAHCIFELVYFARPDSRIFGQWVHETRLAHGRRLAREHPVEADCVTAVPDSGNFAALGYARESGLPLEYAFIRNHYVGRTFILPKQDQRADAVDQKLSVLPQAMHGKRIVIVDDSLVRGTTMRRRVAALKGAGAAEVHLRIACPPVAHPCYYGIDFPTRAELAAGTRTVGQIREMVGADSLGFLSDEGLTDPFIEHDGFCRACFTGRYPIEPGSDDKNLLEHGG